jgi:hypothetical protein
VANHDFGLLVAPTLAALANEPDLLVVVTTGGRPVEAIPGPIPANAPRLIRPPLATVQTWPPRLAGIAKDPRATGAYCGRHRCAARAPAGAMA